jgi:hypothetical protein
MLKDKLERFKDVRAGGFNHAVVVTEYAWTGFWLGVALLALALSSVSEWISEAPQRYHAGKAEEQRRLAEAEAKRTRVQELDGAR